MSLDINDDSDSQFDGAGNFYDGVFKSGFRIRYPRKEEETRVCILPAFGDPADPESWIPFRNSEGAQDDQGNYRLTKWMVRYYAYTFVGKVAHFLDVGRTFDIKDAVDPVGRLVEVASKDQEYRRLCGLGSDGKKSKEEGAFENTLLQHSDDFYLINALCLNPVKEEDAGRGCAYSLRRTMVCGKHDVKDTGLLAALKLQNRGVQGTVDPGDPESFYFWGDITDPGKMIPCKIEKVQPRDAHGKKKGYPYFNMEPDKNAQAFKGNRALLRDRVFLEDTLNRETDPAETVERLVGIFADYPGLLRKAFERQYPGIDNMLKQAGVTSNSRVHQPGRDLEEDLPSATTRSVASKDSPADDRKENKHEGDAAGDGDLPSATGKRSFAPKSSAPEQGKTMPTAERGALLNGGDDLPPSGSKTRSKIGTDADINEKAAQIRRELESLQGTGA